MTPRERILALVLVATIVVVGGGLVGYQFFWKPLVGRSLALGDLQKKIDDKDKQVRELEAKKKQVDYWRAVSLPGNVHQAWGEYQKYLEELVAGSGFTPGAMTVKSREPDTNAPARGSKKPVFTKVNYEIQGFGTMASLVKLLESFYKTPLLHQVKSVDILRPATARPGQKPDELDVKLKIEALIVEGAQKRETLLPPKESAPEPKVLAAKERRYADIAGRNIFFPPPQAETPPKREDVRLHVRLTNITHREDHVEAFLYDRYNNERFRLRASAGFDTFLIRDDDKQPLVQGKVIRIEERDVIFKADDKYYRLHVDQTVSDALRTALSEQEVKELKLETASAQ